MARIRLKDLARMAQVSEAAVSRVLNGKEIRISATKKQEILDLALTYNYQASYVARSLSTNQTQTIGLIIPDIENPFFSSLSKYITSHLQGHDFMVFIANSDDTLVNDTTLIKEMMAREVDGLILCLSNEASASQTFYQNVIASLTIPYVLIDRIFTEKDTNQVTFDNELGGYLATQYLIEQGAKNIACITGRLDTRTGRLRYEGYQRALSEYNLILNADYVYESNFKYESTLDIAREIMKSETIDAVFACNDLMAYAVIHQRLIQEKPTLMVVGYDNLQQSDMFGINLPSVDQNITTLGDTVVEVLFKQLEEGQDSPNIILKPVLILN